MVNPKQIAINSSTNQANTQTVFSGLNVQFTAYKNASGRHGKTFFIQDGQLAKDGDNGFLGDATVRNVGSLLEFAEYLKRAEATDQNEIFGYGIPSPDIKIQRDDFAIVPKKKENRELQPNGIARTEENFTWPNDIIVMLDYDPSKDETTVITSEDLVIKARKVLPFLADVELLWAPSSSSFIYYNDGASGEAQLRGLRGQRLYFILADVFNGSFIKDEFKQKVIDSCWLNGEGRFVASSASVLERGLFDFSVWKPSGLDFVCGAQCKDPRLSQKRPEPVLIPGNKGYVLISDILAFKPDAGIADKLRSEARIAANESHAALAQDYEETRKKDCEISGRVYSAESNERARNDKFLDPDFILYVFNKSSKLEVHTVGDILKDPDTFHKLHTLDPLEPYYGGMYGGPLDESNPQHAAKLNGKTGDEYLITKEGTGRKVGQLQLIIDPSKGFNDYVLHSQAHGGITYVLGQAYRGIADVSAHSDDTVLVERNTGTDLDGCIDTTPSLPEGATLAKMLKWTGTKNPEIKAVFHNLMCILKYDQKFSKRFRYNEWSNTVERKFAGTNWLRVSDTDISKVREAMGGVLEYPDFPFVEIDRAIHAAARYITYHPLKNYLESAKWDGVPRVDRLLIDTFGAKDTPYHREAIRCWLVAAVRRIYEPGYKYDRCLILFGKQGLGKSTFAARLGLGKYFTELHSLENNKVIETILGKWIVELPELSALRKSDVNEIKMILSARSSTGRLAYERNAGTYHRQSVFIGTTNDRNFLMDSTGGRRFDPVEVITPMNYDYLNDELVQQIWAEVYNLHLEGCSTELSQEALIEAEYHRESAREVDDLEGVISSILEEKETQIEGVCVLQIINKLCNRGLVNSAQMTEIRLRRRIIQILDRAIGWRRMGGSGKKRFGNGFGPQTAWVCKTA